MKIYIEIETTDSGNINEAYRLIALYYARHFTENKPKIKRSKKK